MTLAPIQGKCPVCHQDSANTAFQDGAASRDAEIQRLQFALADSEALEFGTAEHCDQLRAELASRESEVAELKQDAIDFHGQVNRLTEWNNNLASHRDELMVERDQLRAQIKQKDVGIAELVAALKPFGAIDLVESRLPAEFAMLILRARAAIAQVRKP